MIAAEVVAAQAQKFEDDAAALSEAQKFEDDAAALSEALGVPVTIKTGQRWGTVSFRFRTITDYQRVWALLDANDTRIQAAQADAFEQGARAQLVCDIGVLGRSTTHPENPFAGCVE